MTFSERAVEAAAAKLTDDGVFVRDEWYDHPVVKRKREDAIEKARDAITAALAVDGLALVPREPTLEMGEAAIASLGKDDDRHAAQVAYDIWTAMLTAASDGEVG